MRYKLLGMLVWKGGRVFLRHRYGHLMPSRKAVAGGLLGLIALGAAATALRQQSGGSAG